jgi:V-type H+-transporting ATPase subunit a
VSLPLTEELWDKKYIEYDKEISEIESMDKLTH